MDPLILPTKLYIPPPRPELVPRPRLIKRLNEGIQAGRQFTLISAPAGYGKTTLLSHWIHDLQIKVVDQDQIVNRRSSTVNHLAWFSLDEDDSDPQQFFNYLAAAIKPCFTNQMALSQLLQSPQLSPSKMLMKAFITDIITVSQPVLLILDDYHLIASADIDLAMAFLLEHMPPHLHLMLVSRSDPGFPISRLRARGKLTELRMDDLRFTEEEVTAFLKKQMGITLSPVQVKALEERTEGWIAGLQMAALSLQHRDDEAVATFIINFTGSHRFVLDYLLDEALDQQSEVIRDFLLATSILDRLSGPLCAAVTQQANSQAILETLERNNLFVVPLDDGRHWYRYHHLFADVLRAYATTQRPDQVADWHRRASIWFAEQDAIPDAIHHRLTAHDFPEAARLIEIIRPTIDGIYQINTWLDWVKSVPAEIIDQRPVLTMGYGWALLENGQLEAAEEYLRKVERWLEAPEQDLIVADETQWQTLPASLANARAYQALAIGNVAEAVQSAQQALDFFPNKSYHPWRVAALSLLGLTYWINGNLEAASEAFAELTQSNLKADKLIDAISTIYVQAEMEIIQGQLNQAEQTIQQMLSKVEREAGLLPLGTSDLYRVLGYLACERGDLATAQQHLQAATKLGEQAALTNWAYRLRVTEAKFKQSLGDLSGALALLEEAETLYIENPLPEVQPIAALKAKLWLAQGELAKVTAWAETYGLSSTDDLSYLQEFEHITLARLLIARYHYHQEDQKLNEAVGLLGRLLVAAEADGRLGSAMEILVLQALVSQNQISQALPPLERALTLAEPQGYVRPFIDEGMPMVKLLQAAQKEEIAAPYIKHLLGFFEPHKESSEALGDANQALIDPLSERELEILALIAAGLKNQEIADQLIISLNTVLYHTKNIYGKLGVNKRALAIAKARELNIIL